MDSLGMTFEPCWKPLEALALRNPKIRMADWMFMGTAHRKDLPLIHLYKHKDTRRYLNLDEHDMFYHYNSPKDTYDYAIEKEALEYALS